MSEHLVTLVTTKEHLREVRHAVRYRIEYLRRKQRDTQPDYRRVSNLRSQGRLEHFLKQIEAQVGDIKYPAA